MGIKKPNYRIIYFKNGERIRMNLERDSGLVVRQMLLKLSQVRIDERTQDGRMFSLALEKASKVKDLRTILKTYFGIEADEDQHVLLTKYADGDIANEQRQFQIFSGGEVCLREGDSGPEGP